MLKNAPTLAIVAVHTDENEPSRVQVKNNEITLTHYLIPSEHLLGVYPNRFSECWAGVSEFEQLRFEIYEK